MINAITFTIIYEEKTFKYRAGHLKQYECEVKNNLKTEHRVLKLNVVVSSFIPTDTKGNNEGQYPTVSDPGIQ